MRSRVGITIGTSVSETRIIKKEDIKEFAYISGDCNPLHMDEKAAEDGPFGEIVAPGMLSAGFISGILGTKMPGPGTIYMGQNLKFLAPVKIGDEITTWVEVREIINLSRGIMRLHTFCMNQRGECVIDGYATVMNKECDITVDEKDNMEKNDAVTTFYSEEELKKIGLKSYGVDVKISRNAVLYQPELLSVGNHVRIDDFTTISGKVTLGDYIHIAQFCGLYGGEEGIEMKDFSGLSSRVVIYATSNDYSGESMTNPTVPDKYKCADKNVKVVVGKHAIIGCTSVILPGANIGEGCSVGAMSMCNKPLEPWGIYVGTPARKVKERSRELLKMEKQLREETS